MTQVASIRNTVAMDRTATSRLLAPTVAVVVASLLAGVGISFGQSADAGDLDSLFNSAAPFVAAAGVAAFAARSRAWAIAFGAAAPLLMVVGYYATSSLRGFGVSTSYVTLWSAAALVAGPLMGWAVWRMRLARAHSQPGGILTPLAGAVWPGVAFGEAAHGIVRISDTTSTAYWIGLAVAGAVVLAITARILRFGPFAIALQVTWAALGGAALFFVYGAI